MQQNKLWDLIAKKLAGEADAAELAELEELLRSHPDMHYSMQTLADLWHQPVPDTEDTQLAYGHHLQRMKAMGLEIEDEPESFTEAPVMPLRKRFLLLSAMFGLVFFIAFYAFNHYNNSNSAKAAVPNRSSNDISEVSTKNGSRTKLQLPDGTQVWLNSGSKLSYDKSYGNGLREVSLSGEAFFDVVKNPALPFVIHTTSIDIKVLGTAFNVKSFPNEKNTETSLIRGSIEVTLKNTSRGKIILKPNEKLISANQDSSYTLTGPAQPARLHAPAVKAPEKPEPLVTVSHITYSPRDSSVIETSWMDNKLIFRSETFEELAVKMERWYGVSIRFADESIKPRRLNGIFENESVQQALEALQLITPFSYKMNKNEIVISSK
jgi:ferric-dicitrate binding protein FerR (iron transport regulator)